MGPPSRWMNWDPDSPHHVLLRARAHPWEPGGNWVVQGLIRRLGTDEHLLGFPAGSLGDDGLGLVGPVASWEEFSRIAYKEFDPDVVMFSLNASRDSGCEEHFLPLALNW